MKRILLLTAAGLCWLAGSLYAQTPMDTLRPVPAYPAVPPPPPPPPPKQHHPVVYEVVMPLFPDCESVWDKEEKKKCSNEALMAFVYGNLRYPPEAKAAKLEGYTVITFTVERDGTISDAKIVRDIGMGCGEEALRVVNLMSEKGIRWTARDVSFTFNLPVRFKLE